MFKILKKNYDLNQLEILAKKIAYKAVLGDMYLLKGELGVGKTTFARYFINAIYEKYLLKKPNSIKSPTFPIMISYALKNFEIFHYDLYRISNKNELKELNIFENIQKNLTLIEWPEIISQHIQIENYFLININIINSDKRKVEITHSQINSFENGI